MPRQNGALTVASPITIRGDPTTDSDYPKDFVCFLVKQLRSAALPTMAIRSQRNQPRSVGASRKPRGSRKAIDSLGAVSDPSAIS
jgi:hypothetical protein